MLIGMKSPKEVHFSAMKRQKSGQDGILRLLTHPLICNENVKISAYHKEFTVVTKIVGFLSSTWQVKLSSTCIREAAISQCPTYFTTACEEKNEFFLALD